MFAIQCFVSCIFIYLFLHFSVFPVSHPSLSNFWSCLYCPLHHVLHETLSICLLFPVLVWRLVFFDSLHQFTYSFVVYHLPFCFWPKLNPRYTTPSFVLMVPHLYISHILAHGFNKFRRKKKKTNNSSFPFFFLLFESIFVVLSCCCDG